MIPLRVASWPPWYAPNRYIERYQAALASHAIEHVPALALDAAQLVRHGVQVAHLHWAEWAWQSRGRFEWSRRRGLHALARFLDDAERRGIVVVWTVHNLVAHDGDTDSDVAGFALLHQRARLRIFHSEHARAIALARYGGAGSTIVMPHGNYDGVLPTPGARSELRATWCIPDDAVLLACVGNARRYKGIDLAIRALEAQGGRRAMLLVAGRCRDARLRRELMAMAAGRADVRLDFSLLSDQGLADLIAASDLVLLPYREVTGSGSLLAALTGQRGVVCTDLPYFREILAPEPLAGVIASDASPASIAAAIDGFCAIDLQERHAAARRLADHYAWDRVVTPVARWLHASVSR